MTEISSGKTDLRGSLCLLFGPHLPKSDEISAESEPNSSFFVFLGISAFFRQSGGITPRLEPALGALIGYSIPENGARLSWLARPFCSGFGSFLSASSMSGAAADPLTSAEARSDLQRFSPVDHPGSRPSSRRAPSPDSFPRTTLGLCL